MSLHYVVLSAVINSVSDAMQFSRAILSADLRTAMKARDQAACEFSRYVGQRNAMKGHIDARVATF